MGWYFYDREWCAGNTPVGPFSTKEAAWANAEISAEDDEDFGPKASEETEFVTNKQWDAYCSRVFNANIKRCGTSLSPAGISRHAYSHIVEHRDDGMIVTKGWRAAMKQVTSQIEGEMRGAE